MTDNLTDTSQRAKPTEGVNISLDLAPDRVRIIATVLEVIALVILCVLKKWPLAIGVAIGAPISELNLRWLQAASAALAGRMVASDGKSRGFRLSFGFIGRYVFLLLLTYVIFKSSRQVLYGFLAALLVPAIALMCEAAYEAVRVVREPK